MAGNPSAPNSLGPALLCSDRRIPRYPPRISIRDSSVICRPASRRVLRRGYVKSKSSRTLVTTRDLKLDISRKPDDIGVEVEKQFATTIRYATSFVPLSNPTTLQMSFRDPVFSSYGTQIDSEHPALISTIHQHEAQRESHVLFGAVAESFE